VPVDLVADLDRDAEVGAHAVEAAQPVQRREQLGCVARAAAQLERARVRLLDLRRGVALRRRQRDAERDAQHQLAALARVPRRQALDRGEAAPQVADRLAVRRAQQRVLRRDHEVADRRCDVVALLEVQRELARHLARVSAAEGLDRARDQTVPALALADRRAVVEHAPVDRVTEAVARGDLAAGRALDAATLEQIARDQALAALLDDERVRVEGHGERRHRELLADHARCREHPLLVGGAARHVLLDERAQARRDLAAKPVERAVDAPRTGVAGELVALEPIVDDVCHEQRVAGGALVQQRGQLARKAVPRKALREVRADRRLGQRLQRQLRALAASEQLARERRERVPLRDEIAGTVGAEHQQACVAAPARERRDQVDRRAVAPVQVLEDQHQRCRRRELAERVQHLAQASLRRDPGGGAQQQREVVLVEQPRHLREPRRREAAQQRHELVERDLLGEVAERLEQRQERLARAVVLEALPLRDADALACRRLLEEGVDQHRLAEPRGAGHEHHLRLAVAREAQRVVQLVLAPDHAGLAVAVGIAARLRGGRRRDHDRRLVRGARALARDRGDEAVAAAMNGLDEARRARVVAEELADLADRDGEHRVADGGLGPDVREQVRLGDELLRPRRQVVQHRQHLRRHRQRLTAAPKAAVGWVDAKVAEGKDRAGRHLPSFGRNPPRSVKRSADEMAQL
jgi:hypothetical protein